MIYVLAATSAYLPMLKNAIAHLKNAGVTPDEIVVYLPDFKYAHDVEFTTVVRAIVLAESLPDHEQLYRQGDWASVVKWKLKVLQHANYSSELIYIDPDVVVFEDLRQHLPSGPWEVCTQKNSLSGKPTMGIACLRKTVFAMNFVVPPPGQIIDDDTIIQSRWNTRDLRLALLDPDQFPVGCAKLKRPPALCYHYNYSKGSKEKIARMRRDGNWII